MVIGVDFEKYTTHNFVYYPLHEMWMILPKSQLGDIELSGHIHIQYGMIYFLDFKLEKAINHLSML